MPSIIEAIARKGSDKEKLAQAVRRRPEQITELLDGLGADQAAIKFGCAKVLRLLSVQQPELLYPHFDRLAALLEHPSKIFQWEGLFVLAELARVDAADRFAALFDRYFAGITGPVMITAANTMLGAARIARAKPDWAERIAREILKVSRARYQTVECRQIAIGHALVALDSMFDLLGEARLAVVAFARRQTANPRAATAKKAQQFLRRHAPSKPAKG